jgi:hypothetical protein
MVLDMISVRFVLILLIWSHSVAALENQSDSKIRSLVEDFSIGTEANVESVKEIDVTSFNRLLQVAQKENKAWTTSFFEIALRIPELDLNGTIQSISVDIEPCDWGMKTFHSKQHV